MQQLPLSDKALRLCREQDDVLTRAQLFGFGVPDGVIRRRLSSGTWSSPMRGVVVIPPVRDELRSAARAAVLSSGGGVLGYRTAARLHGLQGLGAYQVAAEQPHLILGPHCTRAQRRGLRQHFRRLSAEEVVDCAGIPVTSVRRTIADLVRLLDRKTLLFLIDSALHHSLIEVQELPPQVPGALQLLVDGRSESPAESLARLRCFDAGVAPEALQYEIWDGRDFVARLDLAWPSKKVALEVDSRYHDEPEALYRDRVRQNRLVNLGWTVIRVTWHDLLENPIGVLATLFRALGVSGQVKISS